MGENLLSQALGKVSALRIFIQHVRETFLHFSLDAEGLLLDIFHLFLDRGDALLQDGRIKETSIREHRVLPLISGHCG